MFPGLARTFIVLTKPEPSATSLLRDDDVASSNPVTPTQVWSPRRVLELEASLAQI
jgi:hypothetical protein